MSRPPGGSFAAINFSIGGVPAPGSFGGVWISWLVNPINPTSTATKTAANRDHDTPPSHGRIQTSTAAPTQNASAITVASRTVPAIFGLNDTPANVCTSEPGAATAQMANAATTARGINAMIRS